MRLTPSRRVTLPDGHGGDVLRRGRYPRSRQAQRGRWGRRYPAGPKASDSIASSNGWSLAKQSLELGSLPFVRHRPAKASRVVSGSGGRSPEPTGNGIQSQDPAPAKRAKLGKGDPKGAAI